MKRNDTCAAILPQQGYNLLQSRGNYWQGDDDPLQMMVQKEQRIVELWLTRAEKDDPAFQPALKPLFQQYKAQNYLVAVFLSGEADLYQQTRDLLLYNCRRLAEQDVQKQRQPDISL